MSRKIEYPLVPYRATCCVSFDDTLVVFSIHSIEIEVSIHKLVKMVYTCCTSSCLQSIIVEYRYGQEASCQNRVAMTHGS